jgi:signal transduction histidine kinase
MTFLAFTGLLNTAVCGTLAFLVLSEKPRTLLAKSYGYFNLLVALWSVFYTCWQCAGTPAAALPLLRWTIFFGAWPNTMFLVMVFSFKGINPFRRRVLIFDVLIKSILMCTNGLGWMIPSVSRQSEPGFWGPATFWLTCTIVVWNAEGLYGFWVLTDVARQMRRGERDRMYYVLGAFVVGNIGAFSNWLPWYGVGFPAPLNALVSLCSGVLGYAIFRYRVMDIQIVLRRTLMYSLLSGFFLSLYVALISVLTRALGKFHISGSTSPAVAAAVIALLFHPAQQRVQRWIDRRFPRESLHPAMLREATGTFVHEIKRPLANISMPAQLALHDAQLLQRGEIRMEAMLPKLIERLTYIVHQSMDAGANLEAIRNLSSQIPPVIKELRLSDLIRSVLKREEARLKRDDIHVSVEGIGVEDIIKGDETELEVALGNIVRNAIEALSQLDKARMRNLWIRWRAENFVLEIADSGPGISGGSVKRLFDPWFTTKGASGMGIGLYLTQEILQRHGARIEVRSVPNEKTCFRIFFLSPNSKSHE